MTSRLAQHDSIKDLQKDKTNISMERAVFDKAIEFEFRYGSKFWFCKHQVGEINARRDERGKLLTTHSASTAAGEQNQTANVRRGSNGGRVQIQMME